MKDYTLKSMAAFSARQDDDLKHGDLMIDDIERKRDDRMYFSECVQEETLSATGGEDECYG